MQIKLSDILDTENTPIFATGILRHFLKAYLCNATYWIYWIYHEQPILWMVWIYFMIILITSVNVPVYSRMTDFYNKILNKSQMINKISLIIYLGIHLVFQFKGMRSSRLGNVSKRVDLSINMKKICTSEAITSDQQIVTLEEDYAVLGFLGT